MLRKVFLLVVLSVCLFIVGCSQKESVVKAVESPSVESISKSISSGIATSKNGDIITLSRVVLEDNNLKLTFVNYDSKVNSYTITKGDNSTNTVKSSTLTITSADLFQGSEVRVKLNGPASFQLKMELSSNLIGGFDKGQCTEGVATIKTGTNKLPWSGNAKVWFDNARNAGFLVGSTPKVGAIIVFGSAEWNGYSGHVGIVSSINPIKINEKNVPYDSGKWRMNYQISSEYQKSILGYIYYK